MAYNGIQQRAQNTSTINTVTAYTKLIKLYMAGESAYPLTATGCLQLEADTSCTSRNTTLDTNLKKYGSLPSGEGYTQIRYNYQTQTVDGVSSPAMLIYYLNGTNKECGVPKVLNQTGSLTYATDTSAPYNTIPDQGGRTLCYVHVPI